MVYANGELYPSSSFFGNSVKDILSPITRPILRKKIVFSYSTTNHPQPEIIIRREPRLSIAGAAILPQQKNELVIRLAPLQTTWS